jgi:hypothetical protein
MGEPVFAPNHKLRIAQAKHRRLDCGIVRGLEFRMTKAEEGFRIAAMSSPPSI